MLSKKELGQRIKRFRLERNLTLKEVELKAKVSATHVSEIERGMTSPTVGALTKIARALGSEPSYFLESNTYPSVSVVRKDNRRTLNYEDWGARLQLLSRGISHAKMTFVEMSLDPGNSNTPEPIMHTGETFVHVMKGVVEIYLGLERFLMKEGDSIHFKAHQPHTVRNIGDGQVRILVATLPPFAL